MADEMLDDVLVANAQQPPQVGDGESVGAELPNSIEEVDAPIDETETSVDVEPVAEPDESQVAMGRAPKVKPSSSKKRINQAIQESDDVNAVAEGTDQRVPPSEVIGGHVIINPVDENVAARFRDLLNLKPGTAINLPKPPNLGHAEWEGYNLEDKHKAYINVLHKMWEEDIKLQGRGTMTMEQITNSAIEIGWDDAAIALLSRPKGKAVNAEEMARAIWVRLNASYHMQHLVENNLDEELVLWLPFHAAIERNTTAALTEAGRAMAVVSHANKIGALDVNAYSSIPELLKRHGLTPETVENFKAAYRAIPYGPKREQFTKGILRKGLDVWAESFINAYLSSPVTDAVNILSNTLFTTVQLPERLLASGVGAVRVPLNKYLHRKSNRFPILRGLNLLPNEERVRVSEMWTMLRSIGRGMDIGGKAAWKAALHEEGTFGRGKSKIDTRTQKAISAEYLNIKNKPLGAFIDAYGIMTRALGTRMLLIEDEFAKGVLYRMELEALADRRMHEWLDQGMPEDKVVLEGARILSGQDVEISRRAEDFAIRGTFQGDLAAIGGYFQGMFSHPVMKVIVPFYRTPMQIGKEILARSPIAPITPSNFWTDVRKGGADADLAISKFVLGTGIASTAALYATGTMIPEFEITGAGPEDPALRKHWLATGREPYSFAFQDSKTGNWTSWQYGRLEPIAGILAIASDYAYYSQYEDNADNLVELTIQMGLSVYNQVEKLPMTQGILEVATLVGRKFEKGSTKMSRFVELLTEKYSSTLFASLPGTGGSMTATIERVANPTRSDTSPTSEQLGPDSYYTNPVMRGFYKSLNKFKSRNPFFSDDVEPALNLWGETMSQCENGGWCFISPIRVMDSKYAPVDQELVDLGLAIRMPKKTQRGIRLGGDEYNEMIRLMNELDRGDGDMMSEISILISDPDSGYSEMTYKEKITSIRAIVSERKEEILDDMFSEGSSLKIKWDYRSKMMENHGIAPKQ